MNELLQQRNELYQTLLQKFLDTIDEIPMFSKSRKEYCLPYTTLLTILNQEDLIAQIKSSKNREEFKNVVITLIREHEETLSKKLSDEIKQHNMNFTLLLDKFRDTKYGKCYSPKLKKKKTTPDIDAVADNIHIISNEKEPIHTKPKKKVRFTTDKNKTKTSVSFDKKLPANAQILLQSNCFICKEEFDINNLSGSVHNLLQKQIYDYAFSKHQLTSEQQILLDNFGKEISSQIDQNISFLSGNRMNRDNGNPIDHIKNYLDCISALRNHMSVYLINIDLWDSSISNFFSLPYKTSNTTDEDFCNTQMFKIMSKTWFPWCTNNSQFLDMLNVSKLLKTLDSTWFCKLFQQQQLYCHLRCNQIPTYVSWEKFDSSDICNMLLYMKYTINYVNRIIPVNDLVKCLIDRLHILIIPTVGNAYSISKCDNFLWSIFLLEDKKRYFVIERQSNESDRDLFHVYSRIKSDPPLLCPLSITNIQKDWIDKWYSQYWPNIDDVWKSYIKHGYLIPNITETGTSWIIGNRIEVPKTHGLKTSFNECYTLFKMWPEVNYKTMSIHELAVSGFITNKMDLISMLLAEKKLLFFLQTTKHESNDWIEILHHGKGFGYGGSVIKYSDIFSRKNGWNTSHLIGITTREIEFLKLSVEDVCYICIRLQMIFGSLTDNDDSLLNAHIRVSIGNVCSIKNVVPIHNINVDKLSAKPLYGKLNALGQIDITHFRNMLIRSLQPHIVEFALANMSLKKEFDSNAIYIANEDDKEYYSSSDSAVLDNICQKPVQIHRPLPYPILLTHSAKERLGFSGYQGEAIRALPNGRFCIIIQKGNRTAKLLPDVDFQWNDSRFEEDTKTKDTFDKEKDKLLDSYQKESSVSSKMLQQAQHKYYKPTYQDKHYRATFYSLYNPSSKTSITNFLTFLNIQIDLVLQNAFYEYVTRYNTADLIWRIYVRKEIPQKIREMNLNREIVCNYHHILEKVKFYLPNISNEEITSWNTFYFIMKELYKKVKRHCVE